MDYFENVIQYAFYFTPCFLLDLFGLLPCKSCQVVSPILHSFSKLFRDLDTPLHQAPSFQNGISVLQIGEFDTDWKRTLSRFIFNSGTFLNINILRSIS